MAGARKTERLIVGGPPRADLLPPEIKQAKNARGQRRGLVFIVILVLAFVGVGYGATTVAAVAAQVRLDAAVADTGNLFAEKAKYAEVTQVQSQVNGVLAALRVGSSTEVNWLQQMAQAFDALPADALIENFVVTAASPMADYAQATAPLQPARMAEVNLVVELKQFSQVGPWLKQLQKVEAYTDAPIVVATAKDTGGYSVGVTFHFDTRALVQRYDEEGKPLMTYEDLVADLLNTLPSLSAGSAETTEEEVQGDE